MSRLASALWRTLASRALPLVVVGIFLLLYIAVAFATDDALIALMELTRSSAILTVILALLPLNLACRIARECAWYLKRRRAAQGGAAEVPASLYDETVELPDARPLDDLEPHLAADGYRVRRTGGVLSAVRGVDSFPARLLYLVGAFCLFAGILISLTARLSNRSAVIEGEPLPALLGGGNVERIALRPSSGPFLSKSLAMEVTPPGGAPSSRVFGLYPPALYGGAFVYPRYLGIGLQIRFFAPDLPGGYESRVILSIYPPGKEDTAPIGDTPYRVTFTMAEPADGSDPYVTGRMAFPFKVLKGKDVVFSGSLPTGGELARDGYRLSLPESRRVVITDMIRDYGVPLIWASAFLFLAALCIWLPVRLFLPRREMLFKELPGAVQAYSRAQGKERGHAGVFHEALDLLQAARSVTPPN